MTTYYRPAICSLLETIKTNIYGDGGGGGDAFGLQTNVVG